MSTVEDGNPGPWVDYARSEREPWQSRTGIVKFLEFVVPVDGMSERAFHIYWQRHHSAHVMNITEFSQFMKKYNTGHRLPGATVNLPAALAHEHPLVGGAEVWLNSIEEVETWLGKPVYESLIRPDELRFIAQDGSAQIMVGKENRIIDDNPDLEEQNRLKLYLLARRPAGTDYDSFHEKLATDARELLAQTAIRGLLAKAVVTHRLRDPLPAGFETMPLDAVVELWPRDADALRSLCSTDAFAAWTSVLAAMTQEAPRALVARMHVVHDEFSFQPSLTQPLTFTW
jgi:hypothetical protein